MAEPHCVHSVEEDQPILGGGLCGKQPQMAVILEGVAVVVGFYTPWAFVCKYLYLHTLSTFTLGPEEALPFPWVWGDGSHVNST